jgi:uncharacterized alkaline shock family protein YloU
MIAYETILGKVTISEAYLSKLIGHEVTSCFGVVGMVPRSGKQKIFNKFSKSEQVDTGIKVLGDAQNPEIEIHNVVTYGMNLSAIAKSITEKVKYVVFEAIGVDVKKVTVKVDGIKE